MERNYATVMYTDLVDLIADLLTDVEDLLTDVEGLLVRQMVSSSKKPSFYHKIEED